MPGVRRMLAGVAAAVVVVAVVVVLLGGGTTKSRRPGPRQARRLRLGERAIAYVCEQRICVRDCRARRAARAHRGNRPR